MHMEPPAELFRLARSLYRKGYTDDEVSLQLSQTGAGENTRQEIIRQVKQVRLAKKRSTGFFCCGIGVFLLVAGCILTLFLYNSGGNIRFAMYGLTSIGLGFTIKGLVDLLGW